MLSVLLLFMVPDAQACSPAEAHPTASFPADGATDAGLNQQLMIQYTGGVMYYETVVDVWNVETDEVIQGEQKLICEASHHDTSRCVVTFLPESGTWPADSSLAWHVYPEGDEPEASSIEMSGVFSTTDWLSAGELPEEVELQVELTGWRDPDMMCESSSSLVGQYQISAEHIEAGSILQVVATIEPEHDASQPDERVVYQEMITSNGAFSFDQEHWMRGTKQEVCFSSRIHTPDGQVSGDYAGPCVQWDSSGRSNLGSACSTQSRNQSLPLGSLILLGSMVFLRRQRRAH